MTEILNRAFPVYRVKEKQTTCGGTESHKKRPGITKDVGRAMRVSQQLEFGTVWINDHIPLTSETPHGGFKQSGFGKDFSAEAVGDYLVTKHVMIAQ